MKSTLSVAQSSRGSKLTVTPRSGEIRNWISFSNLRQTSLAASSTRLTSDTQTSLFRNVSAANPGSRGGFSHFDSGRCGIIRCFLSGLRGQPLRLESLPKVVFGAVVPRKINHSTHPWKHFLFPFFTRLINFPRYLKKNRQKIFLNLSHLCKFFFLEEKEKKSFPTWKIIYFPPLPHLSPRGSASVAARNPSWNFRFSECGFRVFSETVRFHSRRKCRPNRKKN